MVKGAEDFFKGSPPTDMIVYLSRSTIHAHLQIKSLQLRQPSRAPVVYQQPIGAYTGDQAFFMAVGNQIRKVFSQERFSTAEVHLKNSIGRQVVD